MDKKEFALFAAALKTYYSREEKLLPNNQAMELWFRQLQDIPYKVAEAVLNKWVATNKWSPSIAEIREMASSIMGGDIPDWGEGWKLVLDAVRKYGIYNTAGAMESLTGITKQCVQRLGFRDICLSENIEVERANFRMLYEQLARRQKDERQMPSGLRQMIEQIRMAEIESGVKLLDFGVDE